MFVAHNFLPQSVCRPPQLVSLDGQEASVTGKAIRRYHMLVRVGRFGVERAPSFPPGTIGARAFADVQAAAAALEGHAVAQASSTGRDTRQVKDAARRRLREALRAIGRTARAIAIDSPGLDRRFRAPKSNGDDALITAARGVLREAGEIAGAFVDHGLPATFLDDLAAAVSALERAGEGCRAVKEVCVEATAGVDAVLARTIAPILRLDVVVANVLRDDVTALAVWRQARRVGHGPRPGVQEGPGAATPIRLVANVA